MTTSHMRTGVHQRAGSGVCGADDAVVSEGQGGGADLHRLCRCSGAIHKRLRYVLCLMARLGT